MESTVWLTKSNAADFIGKAVLFTTASKGDYAGILIKVNTETRILKCTVKITRVLKYPNLIAYNNSIQDIFPHENQEEIELWGTKLKPVDATLEDYDYSLKQALKEEIERLVVLIEKNDSFLTNNHAILDELSIRYSGLDNEVQFKNKPIRQSI
ncbi:hypothetical protein [Pseudalkalibacillus caeni]|uniref:Uncharacterized protein n=1 Tax=Exobacillus caeni TaxID=2574798 RepID=A0A5R9FCZ2_9BACL|nr:hypothetical protein [Pseudalkalibacillus caeni]TLS37525.1 hypothetical protein FCL54_10310 [Pseudalkalibacillus caeni]